MLNSGKGKTLSNLLEMAQENESKTSDVSTMLLNTKIDVSPSGLILSHNKREFEMSDWASQQFLKKIGLPSSFVSNCIELGEFGLARDAVNRFKTHTEDTEALFRIYDSKIVGVLSNRYSTFNDSSIIDIAKQNISGEYLINSFRVNPEYTSVRVVGTERMKTEDELYFGFVINNSNVGKSLLKVNFFMFRAMCTNGMIFGKRNLDSYNKKHVGIDWNVIEAEFSSVVESVEERKNFIEQKILESQSKAITSDDVQKFMDTLQQTQVLRKKERETFEAIVGKYPMTEWGKVNMLTEFSRDLDLERREEIETVAGEIFLK